ncbi:MAG: DUF192 domain-containing protein [Patescibacteria group bacterium]
MIKAKTLLFLIFLAVIALVLSSLLLKIEYKDVVIVGGKTFLVKTADTDDERMLGLSGTKKLSTREGMFFVFSRDARHSFWMKDMLFSIDIIWIDKNFEIVHIERDVNPETFPKVFGGEVESRYVLEILSGQAEQLNLKIGDSVTFIKK